MVLFALVCGGALGGGGRCNKNIRRALLFDLWIFLEVTYIYLWFVYFFVVVFLTFLTFTVVACLFKRLGDILCFVCIPVLACVANMFTHKLSVKNHILRFFCFVKHARVVCLVLQMRCKL